MGTKNEVMENLGLLIGILCVMACPMVFGAITLIYSIKHSGHHNE